MKQMLPGRFSVGNKELWEEAKIAFFAPDDAEEVVKEKIRCWSGNQAKKGMCFIGAFHSEAESALFHAALRNGGKAVWILGKSMPEEFSRDEQKALAENRLLVVPCFHRERYTRATSRFANHAAAMNAEAVIFAHISDKSRLYPFFRVLSKKCPNRITRIK